MIRSSLDLQALAGCQRLTGNLSVVTLNVLGFPIANLAGLVALRTIDGDFTLDGASCALPLPQCSAPSYITMDGLSGLRCIGGNFGLSGRTEAQIRLPNLVEVGASLIIDSSLLESQSQVEPFTSLRRVWGNVAAPLSVFPALETVYGSVTSAVSGFIDLPKLQYVGCSDEYEPCRDGVLGCVYDVQTQSNLARLSKCITAVQSLNVYGPDVTDLSPLSKLRSVRGTLSLQNTAITTLAPLGNLTDVDFFSVVDNAQLRSFGTSQLAAIWLYRHT